MSMSRFQIHALLILSLSGIVSVQHAQASPPADAPAPVAPALAAIPEIDVEAMVVEKPSVRPVLQAMTDSGLSNTDAEIVIDYDAAGDVTAVRVTKTSRSGAIDKAILTWAAKLKLKPGASGSGRLPFKLKSS